MDAPGDVEVEVFGVRGVLQSHRGRRGVLQRHGYNRSDDDNAAEIDEQAVYELLGERLQAKAARDYNAADACRERLRSMGVDVFDKTKTWRVRSGGDGGAKALNAQLAHLAHHKQLSACRDAFAAGSAAGQANYWSHAILVNAHATCGDAVGALAALKAMRASGHRPRVMSYTAALKALGGAGDIAGSHQLLGEMEADLGGDGEDFTPNVRTANTFLRGCLVGGGVEEAVGLLSRLGKGVWATTPPGTSALEYVGLLCAQALRLDEATALAERTLTSSGMGRSPAHAAASVRVAICRGAALLGEWERCTAEARTARALLERADEASDNVVSSAPTGDIDDEDRRGSRRFRQHQNDEALAELDRCARLAASQAGAMAVTGTGGGVPDGGQPCALVGDVPLGCLLRRMLPLPPLPPPEHAAHQAGHRAAGADGADDVGRTVSHIERELRSAFGYNEWERRRGGGSACSDADSGSAPAIRAHLRRVVTGRDEAPPIAAAVAPLAGPLNLPELFAHSIDAPIGGAPATDGPKLTKKKTKRKRAKEEAEGEAAVYRLEIGCGAGEWIAAQAEAAPSVRWLAVELRRDRAHATAARAALAGRDNVAVLACDATSALERWVGAGVLDALYCNHPEPPQQAPSAPNATTRPHASAPTTAAAKAPIAEVGDAHCMLDGRLLDAAARALRPGAGTLTIVSDNKWYAELLLGQLSAHGQWESVPGAQPEEGVGGRGRRVDASSGLTLFAAPPGGWCRHSSASSSYFDRLWRRGVSRYSSVDERYVLYVRRRSM